MSGEVLGKDLEEGARDQEKEKNSNKKVNPSPIIKITTRSIAVWASYSC